MRKLLLFICLCFIINKAKAQSTAEDKLGTWFMYNGSHKLSDKFGLKTMAHFRYYELTENFQQEIYRLGLNYTFNPKVNVTLGLSYATADRTYESPSNYLYEYRYYQDLNLKSFWGDFTAKHRFRLEQRFIHQDFNVDAFQNWLRYDLNVSYPLSKTWSVYALNELFLNLDRGKRFAQNWTGAGIIHKLNNTIKLKAGYFQIKTPNEVLKRLQLGIIVNTDFSKKTI